MLTMRQVCAVFDVGSAWAPVIPPVFKTGGRPLQATVCSTHTHFRQASNPCLGRNFFLIVTGKRLLPSGLRIA